MSRRALIICYHYPPISGSSGYQRTVNIVKSLPSHGWDPLVLTVHPRAYPQAGVAEQNRSVVRAWALDAARHLSIWGKYPAMAAWPDRWSSWWLGAVYGSRSIIEKFNPSIIWSTYPIATAHLIGLSLHRRLNVPWIADFRDPMSEDNYSDPTAGRLVRKIERATVSHTSFNVTTTPGAIRLYRAWYPEIPESKWVCIPNGYDNDAFNAAEKTARRPTLESARPLRIVHSGTIYPTERNPAQLFDALKELKSAGKISARDVTLVLRATGNDNAIRAAITTAGIDDIVRLEPSLPYVDALKELLESDVLLILQGSICNNQVPAKVYEYLRARRPILALTDPQGDTASVLKSNGADCVVPLDNADAIAQALPEFLQRVRRNEAALASEQSISQHDRAYGVKRLAELFDQTLLK